MRGRSSSKQGKSRIGASMEIEQVDNDQEEPRLSGAYIRSLVKHLTAKEPLDRDGGLTKSSLFRDINTTQQLQLPPTEPPQPPPHKKQVRRRLHTSRPYQERLLNMAEARREIVTALKFHRASMKQQEAASNHDLQLEQSPPPEPSLGQEKKSKSKRNPILYPSIASAATKYSDVPYHWPISTTAPPPPPSYDNLNLVLPNQTLGLNLNFQNFNLDTSMYSSSSISSSAAEKLAAGQPKEAASSSSGCDGGVLHHAMDEEEMEEIRSLGEQHQMEWNDTVNLVTSMRWCKFLKTMEIKQEDDESDGFHPFDQVMKFPSWLINSNESDTLQQHFHQHISDACLQDPALPCMDIGEIEGMDGEWLA